MTATSRDVMVVSLGAALVRMEADRLTVGQTVDLLMRMIDREGYTIMRKEDEAELRRHRWRRGSDQIPG